MITKRDVYVWFRFEKENLPEGIKLLIVRQLNSRNELKSVPGFCLSPDDSRPLVFENEDSYFIRTKAQSIGKKYLFSIYTQGALNLRYYAYFEKDLDENGTYVFCDAEDGPDHLSIEGFDLGLINIGSVCYIDEKKYYFRKEPISGTMSPLYDYYVLTCCNN